MAEILPEGWAAHLDAGSGRTFYYNAATGETAWEKPQPVAAAASALPEGWVEHLDAGSQRSFFHNASTGETSWERPQPALAALAPAAALGALPVGWMEHVDPGTGRSFFCNAATQETSWERPAPVSAAPENTHPAPGSALPEGWAEHSDPSSGRIFYYKAATGETSWEMPAGAPKGTWATSQANDLGRDPRPPLHILQQNTEVLSTIQGGSWSSVARVVDALNDGALIVAGGLCVLFSASKDSYWLLWRSDKEKEAERVITLQ